MALLFVSVIIIIQIIIMIKIIILSADTTKKCKQTEQTKKLKNIIWYSSYYDFESNCIVRNRRIDLIDWDGILEVIKNIVYGIVLIILYCIAPYIMAYSIYGY